MGLQKHMTLKRTKLLKQPNTILNLIVKLKVNLNNFQLHLLKVNEPDFELDRHQQINCGRTLFQNDKIYKLFFNS